MAGCDRFREDRWRAERVGGRPHALCERCAHWQPPVGGQASLCRAPLPTDARWVARTVQT